MMFRGKQRPHELVFSSCEACNSGTRRSDLVASLLGRVYPDGTDMDTADLRKVLQAVKNNVPGLLQEMMLSNAEQAAAKAKVPAASWALRANGPILTSYILTFGAKLGLALAIGGVFRIAAGFLRPAVEPIPGDHAAFFTHLVHEVVTAVELRRIS